MKDSVIREKSFTFAVRIVKLNQFMNETHKEFVLSKQILRSGTSIGANVREAGHAQSKKDFLYRMQIALKEASETEYWLDLLTETGYIDTNLATFLKNDCIELLKLLTACVKSTRKSLESI